MQKEPQSLQAIFSTKTEEFFIQRDNKVKEFAGKNQDYYVEQFKKIGSSAKFIVSINYWAGLLGSIWFFSRGLWNYGLAFLLLETLAIVQISRGFFGNLAVDAWERIARIESTLALRKDQLANAIENNSEKIDVYKRAIESLENSIGGIRLEAQTLEDSGLFIAFIGFSILFFCKIVQTLLANVLLEKKFSDWLSEPSISKGLSIQRALAGGFFSLAIIAISSIHYSVPSSISWLSEFPTKLSIRLTSINWVEDFFAFAINYGDAFFDSISYFIRLVLDHLELLFVNTPWIVVASVIIFLTWLSAGIRSAIYAAAFLAYIGFLGFWEQAMTTLALLGTAACLSISIGIPLGMFCARRYRFYSFIRPIMDFMQTMPAFVFMIPVIAFFGTGKPAAVVTTMIFGGTPVVRLTVLGLRGVSETVREATVSFGASKWYLLTHIDLPLAAPSIRAGVNQTVMLSLAMVVVASLIGAKGLGEDVLEALQYANVGQGILAGFAILFCAMIIDRIVQGNKN